MFHLTEEQASILIFDFKGLDSKHSETMQDRLQYMKQFSWNATILHIDGGCVVKLYWDFQSEGFFLSGLEDAKDVYYEHLGILEDVWEYDCQEGIAVSDDSIKYGINLELFAEAL